MADYKHNLCFYHCLTPLHVGCGQDVGLVDLPVIREKITGYPYIPGSGIRGALRDKAEQSVLELEEKDKKARKDEIVDLFGPDNSQDGDPSEHSGCTSIHDAKLLFFPVRSNKGVFVYITCPYVLNRLSRELTFFLSPSPLDIPTELVSIPQLTETNFVSVEGYLGGEYMEEYRYDKLTDPEGLDNKLKTFVGDVASKARFTDALSDWLKPRLAIVSDEVFDYYIRNATMVVTHNKLFAAKTVEALFSVESVPPEALFYGIVGVVKPRREASKMSQEDAQKKLRWAVTGKEDGISGHLILGGDESTGLGVTRIAWVA